jgi:Barrel-sandwich domain of CusB or HlyD membrane-fusion
MSAAAPQTSARPPVDPALTAFAALLRVEAEARTVIGVRDLLHLVVNETRALVRARQVFVVKRTRAGTYRVVAASSVPVVDPAAPAVRWIEAMLQRLATTPSSLAVQRDLDLAADADPNDPLTTAYPFRHILWVPFWTRHPSFAAGFLVLREAAWQDADRVVAARLAMTFGHAWSLLESPMPWASKVRWGSRWGWLGAAVLVVLGAVPVPLSSLAPVEVAARNGTTVAMPIDGQVQDVWVAPNTHVEAGQRLIRLVDTQWRNKLEIAEREVAVAVSRAEKANQLAISDVRGRHDLVVARAELSVRQAERDFARDMFARIDITAPSAGVVLFGDKKDLLGRPLATGDRLMEIANPEALELKLELASADAMVLSIGARVKAFLDADPLNPVEAKVARYDYQARVNESRTAVHRVFAEIEPTTTGTLRLGIRGTAQIYGPSAALAYVLLRRPITAARQWAGL